MRPRSRLSAHHFLAASVLSAFGDGCTGKAADSAGANPPEVEPCGETGARGVVIDTLGTPTPSPGARVYIFEGAIARGNPMLETATNAEGWFSVPLPPGTYALVATAVNGCSTESASEVEVPVCGDAEVRLHLRICGGNG